MPPPMLEIGHELATRRANGEMQYVHFSSTFVIISIQTRRILSNHDLQSIARSLVFGFLQSNSDAFHQASNAFDLKSKIARRIHYLLHLCYCRNVVT